MARDRYPNKIGLAKSVEDATEKQERAVEILEESWGKSFNKIAEQNPNISRSTLERTRDKYYGPQGYPITFGEIKRLPEFDGRVSEWMEAEFRGEIGDDGRPITEDDSELSDEEREEIWNEAFFEGRVKGNHEGWVRYDSMLYENLDFELYREVRDAINESGAPVPQ